MTIKEFFLKLFYKYFPYLVVIAAAILSCWVFCYEGIAHGDDLTFHLCMTNDILYGFEHGYFGLSTTHIFMGGFALNNTGFYGPVTHYGAAIFVYLFKGMGATPIEGIKFMIFVSGILGGIYMYKLALKMANGNRAVALIASVLFLFLPYRIFCALARNAFAESIAMALIPMVFYGAYSFLHDKKWHVEPYVAFAVGTILIILSHPFTGLITAIFGVLYMLFNIKGVWKNRKNYIALISMGSAVVVVIFCVLFYVANSVYYEGTNLYNLSDAERQWTTYEHMAIETSRSYDFSGFLNLIYIRNMKDSEWWNGETVSGLIFSAAVYLISMIIVVIVDVFGRKLKYNKWYRHPVAVALAFALPLIFQVRIEIYLALAISLVLYFFVSTLIFKLPDNISDEEPLYKNVDLYFLVFSLIICIILLLVPESWAYVPSILYKGQFAWRMWSITAFLAAMLVTLFMTKLKCNKRVIISAAIVACGLMTMTMGTTEKRVLYEVKPDNVMHKAGYEYAMAVKYSGVQNEMVPQIFYQHEKEGVDYYKSEYANSLYQTVWNRIYYQHNFFYDLESYIKPAFLEGDGDVQITKYNSPNNEFHVVVNSDTALVQFPQIYYQGYVMYSNGKKIAEGQNVDGLVTFELKKGEYDTKLEFKQSKAYQATRPLFYVGLACLVAGGVFGLIYRTKITKKKEEEILQE